MAADTEEQWLDSGLVSTECYQRLPAVDFSFLRLSGFNDMEAEDLRTDTHKPRVDRVTGRYNATTVRFNNNHIAELQGLPAALDKLLARRDALTWLDLSFNQIAAIDDNLTCLTSLRVLYFHGNHVARMSEVAKLASLTRLVRLTLHGNPVEESTSKYRIRVLLLLPWLRSLDFSTVTRRDRALMQFNMIPKPKPKVVEEEDDAL